MNKWVTPLFPEKSLIPIMSELFREPEMLASIASIAMDSPLPLCSAIEDNKELLNTSLGSVVGLPSSSFPQLSGIAFPALAASITYPLATLLSAISRTIIGSDGNAIEIGLLPTLASFPPLGAIIGIVVVVHIPIIPSFAA